MRRAFALPLLLVACTSQDPSATSATSATPAKPATPAPEIPAAYVDVDAATCRLTAELAPPPLLHPRLEAVRAQFFHPGQIPGGFDGYFGGREFPWFDEDSLHQPYLAPPGSRVAAASPGLHALTHQDGRAGVIERYSAAPLWFDQPVYPTQVVDTASGTHWVLARGESTWQLIRVGTDLQSTDLGVPTDDHDVRIAVTRDDRVVVAWRERDGGTLRLKMRAEPDLERVELLEELNVGEALADRSAVSTVELALAPDGATGVAYAWRPLVGDGPPGPPEEWGRTRPYDAEVRWRSVDREGASASAALYVYLRGVGGLGPVGVEPSGVTASHLGGRALFAWYAAGSVQAARADHEKATPLVDADLYSLILLRPGWLLLLHSVNEPRAYRLRCG